MKIAITCYVLLMLTNGCGSDFPKSYIHEMYCTEDGSYHNMTVIFKNKSDTFYVYYINVLDSGRYINGYDLENNSVDYAGYFRLSEIKDSNVKVRIKNYRYEDCYIVNMTFHDGGNQFLWSIDSGAVAYLPQ